MENSMERDDILFEQLKKAKRRKRRRIIITVVLLLILAAVGVTAAVRILRSRVRTQFAASTAEVKSYQAVTGRISTTVSGSGSLAYTDPEDITVPDGVVVEKVLVSAGDVVKAGTPIAEVESNSVLTALANTQSTLESLAKQIESAKNDSTNTYVTSPVTGRVKGIYLKPGDRVVDVMMDRGALVVISLDGSMCLTVDAELEPGSKVTVVTSGTKYTGQVESGNAGKSVIQLTDNGPLNGAEAVVQDSSGQILGAGILEIRNPLSITGYAGTATSLSVQENQQVYLGSTLFVLQNTQYSANYDTLLRQRGEAEQTLQKLIGLLRTGCVEAPFDGIITSVSESGDAMSAAASAYLGQGTGTASSAVATIARDQEVSVAVAVDETDILSLELGQTAEVTVSSVGEEVYRGRVTEISRIGVSASGVTQYTAVVTMPKAPKMLSGMTANVDIQIQGVDDVVLIPAAALHQTRATSYVFTTYDAEAKEYGGMVEVVTGASNSSFVEIVSGLKPGDTVYYTERTSNNPFSMMPMGSNYGSNNRGSGNNNWNSNGGNNRGSSNNRGMGG